MGKWRKTKIGEFLFEREGKYKPDSEAITGLKRIDKIDFSGNFHIAQKPSKTNMILIRPGDLVISGINVAKGAMGIYRGNEDVTATIHYSSYTFDEQKIDVGYFKRFLKSAEFIRLLQEQVKGGIKTEIKPKHILPLEIDLPDIEKQREIVAHFKSIETEDAELKTELAHQQTLLKKLRQQILQEAIEGKLTADWRKQNPDVEPASELLKRIQAEKAQLIKDKKIKKQKPLPPISDEEKPFELPDGWVWLKIDYFLEYKKRGLITGPFGTALQKSEHQSKGTPVYGIETIKNGKFTYRNKIFVTTEKANELSSFSAEPGDIIISRSGTIDEICTVPEDAELGLISTNLLRVSLLPELIESEYFCYLFKGSITVLEKLKELCSGSTRLFLNQKILKALVFPLPPLPEQKAIVTKVEKLLALCDQLESQITRNQSHAEQLMQAVLREAFSQPSEQAEKEASCV